MPEGDVAERGCAYGACYVGVVSMVMHDVFGNQLPRASRAADRSEQSSSRSETNPGFGAVAKAATTYSIDLLSKGF